MAMIGPGKYDDLCTYVREQTDAPAAIVIVIGGKLGSGFSCQAEKNITGVLPALLEQIATDIRNAQREDQP